MFTGIIEGIGTIKSIKKRGQNASFEVAVDFDLEDVNVGDSISIDGCCLTVTSRLGKHFWVDLSDETLRISTLGSLKDGHEVNVERALKVGSRLGGHIVQGHVDGVGKIVQIQDVTGGGKIELEVPERLTRYIVDKGSITIDGISLTVNKITGIMAEIRIIPHTMTSTTLKKKRAGAHVNLEVDIIGKYVEKLHFLGSEEYHEKGRVTEEFLKKHGF